MKKSIVLIFLFWGMLSFAQTRTIPYEFPVKPGSAEWKKFQSRSEMGDALQIPSQILKDLTTEALIKTCLEFPMFQDLFFFNTVQTGFNGLRESFNGFQELLNRKDASLELLKLYKQINPGDLKSRKNDIEKGDFTFQFVKIEILLAQDQIIKGLPAGTENELQKEAAKKYELKKATGGFSDFSISPSVLVMGRILEKQGKLQKLKARFSNDGMQKFLSTGLAREPEILEQIWLLSRE
jgi:hypothetical protein